MLVAMKEHYADQDPATLEKDLDAYLAQLEEAKCIDRVEG